MLGCEALGCKTIEAVFEQTFRHSHRVQLQGGAPEPLYLPAQDPHAFHQLIYTLDYPASALHEIAHWCLASDDQLLLKDWGHWYVPDGRTAEQQARFQGAEARVQALEWILSKAAGRPFRESADNLGGEGLDPSPFRQAIHQQVARYCEQGLPPRALALAQALAAARQQRFSLSLDDYPLAALTAMTAAESIS